LTVRTMSVALRGSLLQLYQPWLGFVAQRVAKYRSNAF